MRRFRSMPPIARVAIMFALLALVLAPQRAVAAEPVRIAQQFGISYLPVIVMQDLHLLEEEGRARGVELAPEWITYSNGTPINEALISGSLDIGSGGIGPMLIIWARTRANLKVRGLATLNAMPLWLTTSNPRVKTIADFTERDRIALPAAKVSIQAVVLQMAARQVFGPGQETRLDTLTVSMGHPDALINLLGGKSEIDAHFGSAPYMYDELADPRIHRVLDSFEVLGGPHSFNAVWTTTRYHDGHPQVIAAFLAALRRALELIRTEPETAAASWIRTQKTQLTVEQAAAMIRLPENHWTMAPRKLEEIARFMRDTGTLQVSPESWKDVFFPDIHDLDGN